MWRNKGADLLRSYCAAEVRAYVNGEVFVIFFFFFFFLGGGGQGRCERRSFCENSKRKLMGGRVGGGGSGGQGGCERGIEVFVKIQFFLFIFFGGRGVGSGRGRGSR